MTIINDEAVFNVAGTQGDWTGTSFDPPVDNNSSSSTEIYREGTGCQEWVMKENITTGSAHTSTLGGTKDISNGEVVVFWFFVTSDADLDKLSLFRLRLSSDTGFTTNYAEWDAKAQIENLDLYGWFPVTVYPTNPDATAGTIVYSSIDSIGWIATTGGTGTKLTGFDHSHSISYIGGHSQTVTLADLKSDNDTNDLGVMFQFADFLKSTVNIRLGGGTTANTVFEETNKGLFFDNIEPEHNLGFQFINPSSTGQVHFNLDGWAVSWNEQTGTTPEIFTNPEHCDEFTIDGCSFARGGAFTTRTWISDVLTFVQNTSINNCDQIDPRNLLFQDNSIVNSRNTAADEGALLLDAEGSARWHRLSFTRGSSGHAIVITATGTYDFDTFTYSGYGADATATSAVRNESGGAVTINVNGGDTPTVQNGTGASTTLVINPVSLAITVNDNVGAALQNARVLAEASDGTGDLPFEDTVTITRSGSTATVAHTAHGMVTGDYAVIRGANQQEYNGPFAIANISTNAYDYTVTGTPVTPATGTITSTGALLHGLTNASGLISRSRSYALSQPVRGFARKATGSPTFKDFDLAGNTVDKDNGLSINIRMILDE